MYILLYLDCVCVKVYTAIYTLGHCGVNAYPVDSSTPFCCAWLPCSRK